MKHLRNLLKGFNGSNENSLNKRLLKSLSEYIFNCCVKNERVFIK